MVGEGDISKIHYIKNRHASVFDEWVAPTTDRHVSYRSD